MTRLALLAAQLDEVAPLLARLGARRDGRDAAAAYWSGECNGIEVAIAIGGMGRRRARAAAGALLDRAGVSRLLVVGVAGALTPGLAAGALAVAATVSTEEGESFELDPPAVRAASSLGARVAAIVTVDRMIATLAERRALLGSLSSQVLLARPAGGGATADGCPAAGVATGGGDALPSPVLVDMESYDAVAEAVRRGVPATVLRAVSDTASEALPSFLARCRRADGDLDRRRVVLQALTHPASIPALLELGRRVRVCAARLAEVVPGLLSALGEPSAPTEV